MMAARFSADTPGVPLSAKLASARDTPGPLAIESIVGRRPCAPCGPHAQVIRRKSIAIGVVVVVVGISHGDVFYPGQLHE